MAENAQMASAKVDGNTYVGQRLRVGGDTDMRGNAHVERNLKVCGRLIAHAIEGNDCGFFPTSQALEAAYPEPKAGWWAYVGNTVPGQVYIVDNGAWRATGYFGDISGFAVDSITIPEVDSILQATDLIL